MKRFTINLRSYLKITLMGEIKMALDANFVKHAESAFSPSMGTESMAPLLYSIVRFTRPQNVLEIGAGFTTLYLLKGLADNAADHLKELVSIKQEAADRASGKPEKNSDADVRFKNYEYYLSSYTPKLYTVD